MAEAIILCPEYTLTDPASEPAAGTVVAVVNDRIAAIGDRKALTSRWPAAQVIELANCLLMPGLVNAHQHGRGLSQIQLGFHDRFLEAWIAGRRARGVLDAFAITRLAAARMVTNGVTTTIHANYSYFSGNYEKEVRDQLRAYDAVGLRVAMCVGAMDQGSIVYPPHEACFMAGLNQDLKSWLDKPASAAYAGDSAATLALMARLLHDFAQHPRIRFCYGPAGPQWVSDDMWRMIARDAAERGLGIHFHALESPAQRLAVQELYPEGVFQHLEELGAMTARTVVAHGVWANESDMKLLAGIGATVVRNPGSNIRLHNGIAPLARYVKHGVRVAIGTDNCSIMDDEDLLSELRLAGHLAREPDWNAPPPPDLKTMVAMATTNGAIAAQFGDEIGVLAPGKRADIVAFSLDRTRKPWLDPEAPLLEAFLSRAQGADTRLTMIDGRILYHQGVFTDSNLADVEAAAATSARTARLPADPANRDRTVRLLGHLCDHYRDLSGKIATKN